MIMIMIIIGALPAVVEPDVACGLADVRQGADEARLHSREDREALLESSDTWGRVSVPLS